MRNQQETMKNAGWFTTAAVDPPMCMLDGFLPALLPSAAPLRSPHV